MGPTKLPQHEVSNVCALSYASENGLMYPEAGDKRRKDMKDGNSGGIRIVAVLV